MSHTFIVNKLLNTINHKDIHNHNHNHRVQNTINHQNIANTQSNLLFYFKVYINMSHTFIVNKRHKYHQFQTKYRISSIIKIPFFFNRNYKRVYIKTSCAQPFITVVA